MDRRSFLATAAGSSLPLVAGCLGRGKRTTTTTTGPFDVGMSSRRFHPAEVTVTSGTTVVWKNTSSHAHTVTAYQDSLPDGAQFFSTGDFDGEEAARNGWFNGANGALYSGDTYQHTFEVPGKYPYFCIPHEASGMVGTVVVSEK
ncbi:MAG: plastocyanin/azurin family copper-binding protein [Haloarculaceae archaeon]